jgi:hypothetical protein
MWNLFCHHDITKEDLESTWLVEDAEVGSVTVDGDMVGDDMWSSLNSVF